MRKFTLAISLVLLLAVGVQVSYVVDSFPGFHGNGECSVCHNEPATAYDSAYMDSSITLDGLANEAFFTSTQYREMRVPVGTTFGGVHEWITMIFAQNSTHLFIYAQWEDVEIDGSSTTRYTDADGIAILWNINATEQADAYFSGMKTVNADEHEDVWVWKADTTASSVGVNASADYVHAPGNTVDTSIDDAGWVDGDFSADVKTNATWGYHGAHAESTYGIEFVRPLVTSDANDVQFDQIGYYDFAIAIYNGSSGSAHAVSFQHSLWVYGVCTTGCDIPVTVTDTLSIFTETQDPVTETLPAVTNNVNVTQTETETSTEAPISALFVLIGLGSMGMLVNLRRRK